MFAPGTCYDTVLRIDPTIALVARQLLLGRAPDDIVHVLRRRGVLGTAHPGWTMSHYNEFALGPDLESR